MTASTIWIPCEAFDVVLTASDDTPTDLEKAVMLFLVARQDDCLEDVVAFLGLSERLTMDLLIGLWRQGYIIVDTVDGGVRLDPAWETRVQADRWDDMESAHRVSDTVELMRELVSGQIVADRSSPAAPPPEHAVPVLVPSTIAEAVTRPELAAVAMRSLGRNSPLASRVRKVRAEFARARTGGSPRPISWLRLDFEPELDGDEGRNLTLRPAATDDMVLARVAPAIARALNDWALGNAEHPVVRNLVAAASRVVQKPRRSLAARLGALVAELEAAVGDPAGHDDRAGELVQTLAALTGEIDQVEAARGKATFTRLGPDTPSFLHQATGFDHQLVLTAPRLTAEGLDALAEALVPHLRQCAVDSSAVILWGAGRSAPLSGPSASFLANMAAETSGPDGPRLRWSHRNARVSTPMAILDGQTVLCSNVSPLGAASPDDFGWLLKIEAGSRSALPRRLLEIARERAPEVEMAELIQLRPWSPAGAPARPKLAEDPAGVDILDLGDEDADPDVASVLTQQTRLHDVLGAARREARRLAGAEASVEAVVDAALFKAALEIVADPDPASYEPTLWLGLGQDFHTGRSVPLHRSLVEGIAGRAAKGLLTVILVEQAADRWPVDTGNLVATSGRFPDLVRIIPVSGLTGHFVCGDDRFLAAPGGLASPAAPEVRHLASRLVGILATDPDLCTEFRAALVLQWPELGNLKAKTGAKKPVPSDALVSAEVALAPVYQAWRRAGPGGRQALTTAMAGPGGFDGGSARALLDLTARAADGESRALRRDLLAVMAMRADGLLRQSALGELAAQAWSDGRWQQAAILADALEQPAVVSADLATAMADVAAGIDLTDLPAALQSADPDEWIASVALASSAVLFNGDALMAEALEIKLSLGGVPAGSEPLVDVAEAVLAFWAASGGEVDMSAVSALVGRETARGSLSARATALCDAFRLGASANYNNAMLKRVVPRFYTTTSGVKPVVDLLSTAAAVPDWGRVLSALNRMLGENPDADSLADDILERTHREYAETRHEAIQGRKGAAIRLGTRELMHRALELRDAIRAARDGDERTADDALASLLRTLRPTRLGAMAEAMAAGNRARPVVDDLARRVAQLAAESS